MSSLIGKQIDQYTLIRPVGHGGVASVFLAHDQTLDRDVALKILLPTALDDATRTRFQLEAQLLFQFDHPNIVEVLDYGVSDGMAYLVLPYYEAGTLKDRLDQGPLSPKEGAKIISQLASALQYAHDEGIIHRDVKPSNVLFDENGNALLTDFGFAHLMSGSMSLTGSALIGTPSYMSPEQIQGEVLSPQTDQYALGVILYEISTGSLPYSADSPMAVAIKHATEPLPRPASINQNLPAAVERVIIRSLAKDPGRRFSSVQVMNDSFQDALLSSIDPSTGRLRPEALIRDPLTLDAAHAELPSGHFARERERKQRWGILLAFLLFLLACPLSVWLGMTAWPDLFPRNQVAYADATLIFQAVLETYNAQDREEAFSPEEINTAVAQTLESGLIPASLSGETPTPDPASTSPLDEQASISPTQPSDAQPSPSATETESTAGSGSNLPTATIPSAGTPTASRTLILLTSPPIISTASLTPSPTMTPSPTSTASLMPFPTMKPSPTPTATRTDTPVPVNPCDQISISGFSISNKDAHWTITNTNATPVVAVGAVLSWPEDNEELTRVKLGSFLIWSGEAEASPTSMSFSGSASSRSIAASAVLEFHFDDPARSSGYNLSVTFSNGCAISP